MHGRHQNRRPHPVAANVADHRKERSASKEQKVEVVASRECGGVASARDFKAGDPRCGFGQQVGLNLLGRDQLGPLFLERFVPCVDAG